MKDLLQQDNNAMAVNIDYADKVWKDYLTRLKEFTEQKEPIRKGCPNKQCFCTGSCMEIVGWRDKTEEELRNFKP